MSSNEAINDTNSNSSDVQFIKAEADTDEICELEHLRKLFIGGLSPNTTEEKLKKFYEQWGKVVDVVVMRDSSTKRSRGFGFITYTKSAMVDKAQANRPHVIDEKTVEAKRALPRPEREAREPANITVKKLFVGGLKDNHDEDCLKEYFSQFGNVVSVKILTDRTTGKRRGFAFIEFDDYDAVDKAILQKTHCIKFVVIDVKKSIYSQEKQNKQMQNNTNENTNMNNAPAMKMQPKKAGAPQQNYPQVKPMMPHQRPPVMNGYPPAPPNYNYWGPPPPQAMPQQYGYQQAPPQAPMNNWSYPPAPNAWNPAQPQANGWQTNQWGYPAPPPNVGTAPPQNTGWNTAPAAVPPPPPGIRPPPVQQPQPNWHLPQVPPPGTPATPVGPPPPNFGTGYQQNYGGGPTKHSMNGNRPKPYGPAPVQNGYVNPVPPVGPPGSVPKPISNGAAAPVPPVGGNYRR